MKEVKQGNVSCINLYDQDFYCYFQINNPAVIFRDMTRYLKYYIYIFFFFLPLAETVV